MGVDIADISSIGDIVKNGKIIHSGKIKVCKSIDTDVGKTSQNGRRGSATVFVNFYDPEIETILLILRVITLQLPVITPVRPVVGLKVFSASSFLNLQL